MKSIIGIDIGSRYVKIVKLQNNEFVYKYKIDTAKFYKEFCSNNNEKILIDYNKLNINDNDRIVSTGYGRNNVNINNARVIQELKAHYLGAIKQTGLSDFVLLDVGGQDTKVVKVINSKIVDIALNDKCAASCGRFLENMSNLLDISLDEMAKYYLNPVVINSTCAIFSESEIIGYISEGKQIQQIAAGVNYSLYNRLVPLIEKYEAKTLIVAGGVANNKGFLEFLKTNKYYKEVIVPEYPIYNGAIGCCEFELRS